MSKFLVFLFSAFCLSTAAPFSNGTLLSSANSTDLCAIGNIIHPTASSSFYYPSTWRENQTAPALDAAKSCSWLVTVPQGHFAKLVVSGQVSKLQLIDSAGNVDQSSNETMTPYYFTSPKFTIGLSSSNSSATFAFKVVWAPLPTNLESNFVNYTALVKEITANASGFSVGSGSRVSLLPVPSNPSNPVSLRSVVVFQGESTNEQYITNLYRIYQSGQQLASIGQALTIVNLEASNSSDVLIVQNFQYTKDIHDYKGFTCSANSTCSVQVNSGMRSSAAVSVNTNTEVLTAVRMDASASLTVYYGSTSDACKVAQFSANKIQSLLPMSFSGNCTQYVVSSGKAYLEINRM
ncbi:unnamed protein product [Caenorhabditis sp. 36 PRJEB53466]|nr:unnamed protein product [Caenorhabditis sp. 36 PRJEB53466]